MHIGSSNQNYIYKIDDTDLNVTTLERDLGVNFSNDLKWKQHVIATASKANSMLGMIMRSFLQMDVKTLRVLYTTFVRPLLEFLGTSLVTLPSRRY